MDKKIVVGKINIFLENEMIQLINDELNLTFTTDETLAQVEKAFQSNVKAISFNDESYVGYSQIKSIGYSINNEDKMIYKVVLIKPKEAVGAITLAEEKAIAYAINNMSDEEALTCIDVFPEYAIGITYEVGDRVKNDTNLYKCKQAHTSEDTEDRALELSPAFWNLIAPNDSNIGTATNPITIQEPFSSMEYEYGKYYKEGADVYLMNKTGMKVGDKISSTHKPSQMLGHYFIKC